MCQSPWGHGAPHGLGNTECDKARTPLAAGPGERYLFFFSQPFLLLLFPLLLQLSPVGHEIRFPPTRARHADEARVPKEAPRAVRGLERLPGRRGAPGPASAGGHSLQGLLPLPAPLLLEPLLLRLLLLILLSLLPPLLLLQLLLFLPLLPGFFLGPPGLLLQLLLLFFFGP